MRLRELLEGVAAIRLGKAVLLTFSAQLFSVSITVLQRVMLLFSSPLGMFLQRESLLRAAGDYSAINKLLRWAMVPFVLIALAGGVFLYFFSDFVIWLLYTIAILTWRILLAKKSRGQRSGATL